jgi:filamentous hemagglutinin family protein
MPTPHHVKFTAALAGAALLLARAAAAHPPLPTPCLAGNCGTSAQSFVTYGTAGATLSGTTLNVTQSSSKAILNWADFNIANGYSVNFLQPGATSAVLNKIWSADPSVIAGRLNANGQVYLYNQNGIVFDKGAQIDVAGLTASTLRFAPLSNSQDPDALFESGILSQNTAGKPPNAVFVAAPSGNSGAITVNSGASLTAADGGRIMLLGSAVTNSGSISTPDGQTILGAAGKSVYLAASTSPDMRGLLIEVDDRGATGTVINNGQISAPRGNITLAGLIVNQQGLLSATTSVSANGSIYLVAGDTSAGNNFYNSNPASPSGAPTAFGGLLPNNGGTLLLTPGSVTQVLPDPTDTGTLTVAQQGGFIPSEVNLAGRVVALEGNASIRAPGGLVNAYAAANPYQQVISPTTLVVDGGSIYLDSGSSIDVSGLTNVAVPVTQNLVQVTLETNDLQNDPLLRNGFLHGTTVTVDLNEPGPALFDVTPYANNVGSNIQQVLTKAGAINLDASSELITRAGSTLNVSGGSVVYRRERASLQHQHCAEHSPIRRCFQQLLLYGSNLGRLG